MVRGKVGATTVLILFVSSMIAGQILSQPILLSYVETGSMEPTIDRGDGFVAIPSQLIGEIDEGDVVIYRAEEIQNGGLITHRVIDKNSRGYVTKGDANSFTDQDNDEPPVKREQIVAVAWRFGGRVVVIPHLGTIIETVGLAFDTVQSLLFRLSGTRVFFGTQGLAYLLLVLTAVAYAVDRRTGKGRNRDRNRDTGMNVRLFVSIFTAVVVVSVTVTMVLPSGPQQFGVVSAEHDAPGARVIERGTSETRPYPVYNGISIPMIVFLESGGDGVAVQPRELNVESHSFRNATLSLSAPPETGYYRYYVTEYRYLAVFPPSHIRILYEVHPWLPIVAIDALLGIPFYLLGIKLVGTGRIRSRSRDAPSRLRRIVSRYTGIVSRQKD